MHMRKRRIGTLTAEAALVCTITACGSSGGTASGSGGGGGGQGKLGTITVGVGTSPPDITSHQFYYALKNGFYKKRGLTVKIKPLKDDQTAVRALESGNVNVVWTGALAGMTAMEKGASIKAISATTPKLSFQLVGSKSIKQPKGMEGHKVGISEPGAVSAVSTNLMLEKDGGSKSKVQEVSIGGSGARASGLVAKKIDAAVLNQPYVSQMTKHSFLHVIAKAGDVLPKFLYSFELASNKMIKNRPEAVKAFVAGTVEADNWADTHPKKATTISHEVLSNSPKSSIKVAIDSLSGSNYWSKDGKITKQQWNFTANALVNNKLIPKPAGYSKYVATQFTGGS
jgi:ABC-type nitrate/sulfonate/bicarbonate transport system substrate-binding protein